MLIFFLCRERPGLGAGLYILFWLPALWSGDESPVWDQRPPRAPAPVRMPAYDRFHPLSGQRRTAQRRKML